MLFPLATCRPDVRYIWRGPSMLVVEPDGRSADHPLTGWFFRQTRFLRKLQFQIDGVTPHFCSVAELAPNELELTYVHPDVTKGGGGGSGSGREPGANGMLSRTLDIRLRFVVRARSLRATLSLTNRWQQHAEVDVAWLLSTDYASVYDAGFDHTVLRGDVSSHVQENGVVLRHGNERLPFETDVRGTESSWNFANGALSTRVVLPRQETVMLGLEIRAMDPHDPIDDADEAEREACVDAWLAGTARLHAAGESPLVEYTERAVSDLASLAMLEGARDEWLAPAAGAPLYLALWGRDALTAGWQSGILDRGAQLGAALARAARLQGTREDPQRDEEPGRIINQVKLDPAARLGENPFSRYYADVASPFMFIIGLGYHYALTGDLDAVRGHWDVAKRVMTWADTYGDRDNDGYIEYLTTSPDGPTHQGWKDSENAVVYADGEPVAPPIASCEIQGYWHASLQYMAVLSFALGERAEAVSFWRRAADLHERFNRDFWIEDEGFIAFGLDAEKRQIRALTSNSGHCLPTGIVARERVPRLVRRLFQPDLFSGWGIRTLSTGNSAYNPLDYHLGSIWPVENATIVFGLRRYGMNDRALELTRSLYDLARLWPGGRIPECVGGYAREDGGHPGLYPRANSPQAWNQSAWPLLVQSLLGLVPFAPFHLLLVDPILPTWLPELTVRDVRVGDARVSLRFWRDSGGDSHYEVTEQSGKLRVLRQPWLESLSTGLWERFTDAAGSLRGRS